MSVYFAEWFSGEGLEYEADSDAEAVRYAKEHSDGTLIRVLRISEPEDILIYKLQ